MQKNTTNDLRRIILRFCAPGAILKCMFNNVRKLWATKLSQNKFAKNVVHATNACVGKFYVYFLFFLYLEFCGNFVPTQVTSALASMFTIYSLCTLVLRQFCSRIIYVCLPNYLFFANIFYLIWYSLKIEMYCTWKCCILLL